MATKMPSASSLDFSFSSPENVRLNESFDVQIEAQATETYDVKIFAYDQEYKNTISEIFDSEWRSPFKYILSAYPRHSVFKIRIVSYVPETEVCVQMRKAGAGSYERVCKSIVIKNENFQEEEQENEPNEEELGENYNPPAQKKAGENNVRTNNIIQLNSEPIILNPLSQDSYKEVSSDGKNRTFILYGFIDFCIFVLLFLSLRLL